MPEIYGLHAWEPHPDYPETEVRRDNGERIILSLAPEGEDEDMCWAWTVHPAQDLPLRHGVNLGSDLNKEVARRQAEAAALRYGYTFEDPRSDNEVARQEAPSIALTIVGLRVDDAARLAQEAGVTFRVGRDNGRPRPITDDINRNRVTVTLVNGVVTEAEPR
jgi:hypothetical protein